MKTSTFTLLSAFTLTASVLLRAAPAAACACCSEPGERVESVTKLAAHERSELERVRFGETARLYTTAAGTAGVKGITDATDTYALTQTRAGDRWTFTLKDAKGRTGTLAFTLPSQVESFFVDTQQGKASGEPVLYKEWRLSAPLSATGIFAPAAASGSPTVRLVLQGQGNSCTSADQFTAFSIVVTGPSASFTLFGRLAAPAP